MGDRHAFITCFSIFSPSEWAAFSKLILLPLASLQELTLAALIGAAVAVLLLLHGLPNYMVMIV